MRCEVRSPAAYRRSSRQQCVRQAPRGRLRGGMHVQGELGRYLRTIMYKFMEKVLFGDISSALIMVHSLHHHLILLQAPECVWCTSAAVGGGCYTADEVNIHNIAITTRQALNKSSVRSCFFIHFPFRQSYCPRLYLNARSLRRYKLKFWCIITIFSFIFNACRTAYRCIYRYHQMIHCYRP